MSLPLMPARADAPPEVGSSSAAAGTARAGRRGRSPVSVTPPAEPAVPAAPTGSEAAAADAALLVRLSDRETTALDALYQRYGRPAYSLARRICADDGLAEDVVQEVFLALWRDPG